MTELDIVYSLGLRTSHLRSRQLIAALIIIHEREDSLYNVSKNLYPQIAKQFNSRDENVERNIRSAAESCWNYGNRELLQQMAGYKLSKAPSAKEFLDILVTYRLRHEQKSPTLSSLVSSQK